MKIISFIEQKQSATIFQLYIWGLISAQLINMFKNLHD